MGEQGLEVCSICGALREVESWFESVPNLRFIPLNAIELAVYNSIVVAFGLQCESVVYTMPIQ